MASASAEHTRIVLRPIAVPLPLAFTALAVGSLIVSAQELGWIGLDAGFEVGIVLLALVAPLQVIAAIFGFLSRDPVAATGVTLIAAAWLVSGLGRVVPDAEADPFGIALLAVAVALVIPIAAASLGKLLVAALLALTATRFALSGAYAISESPAIGDIGGVLGLVVFALALYTALAIELEAIGHGELPLGRHASATTSVHGPFAEQVEGIEHEPGVRRRI